MTALAKWAGRDCIEATTDGTLEHFAFVAHYLGYAKREEPLKKTMRRENTDWGDTVGVFEKTIETGASRGMDYIRRFAALHPGQGHPATE